MRRPSGVCGERDGIRVLRVARGCPRPSPTACQPPTPTLYPRCLTQFLERAMLSCTYHGSVRTQFLSNFTCLTLLDPSRPEPVSPGWSSLPGTPRPTPQPGDSALSTPTHAPPRLSGCCWPGSPSSFSPFSVPLCALRGGVYGPNQPLPLPADFQADFQVDPATGGWEGGREGSSRGRSSSPCTTCTTAAFFRPSLDGHCWLLPGQAEALLNYSRP